MRRILLCAWLTIVALAAAIPMQAIKVYYNNPNHWTKVCAYVYDTKGNKNKAWPGVEITKPSGLNVYSYVVPEDLASDCMVIFNDGGSNQYPASDGKAIKGKSMLLAQNATNDSETKWYAVSDAETTVYFNNRATLWETPHYYYFGNAEIEGAWPGKPMTKATDATNVYVATIPEASNVIFTNGAKSDTKKTADLVPVNGHVYDMTGDKGIYTGEEAADKPFNVYFDNTLAGWATPTIHYWGGDSESTWPGVAMTLHSGKIWKYEVPAGTTSILFNAGDGDATKTKDMVATKDHVYTQSGDSNKAIDEYTSTVEVPSALRIIGNLKGKNWVTTEAGTIAMTKDGNKYTASNVEIVANTVGAEVGYFTFITSAGANWDAVNSHDRYGAKADGATITIGSDKTGTSEMSKYPANVNASAAKNWGVAPGKYDIEVDFEAMTVKLTDKTEAITTGVATLSIPDATVHQGSEGQLTVSFTMNKPVIGVQFDITLPEGVTQVTGATPVLSDVMSSTHTVHSGTVDGKIRVIIYSADNSVFSRQNGNLIYLPIKAASDLNLGTYDVTISNLIFSDKDRKPVTVASTTGHIIIDEAPASQITLNETNVVLAIGAQKQLVATLDPAVEKTILWSSSNTDVATVTSNGLVTGIAKGTALITATCDGVSASATVTVGKKAQTIVWDQELPANLGVGEANKIQLTATSKDDADEATGLDVEFSIISGNTFAKIEEGYLIGLTAGKVTIQANQRGNDEYAPADPVERTINVWLGYIEGDADGNGKIELADITMTVGYICGDNPAGFVAAAADLDGSGDITIADVTLLIDLVLNQPKSSEPTAVHALAASSMERFAINAVDSYELDVNVTNMSNYIATMFEMTLPEDAVVSQAYVKGSNHSVAFRKLDETTTRFIVTSLDNSTFNAAGTINIVFDNAVAGDVAVKAPILNDASYTDIKALGAATTVGASAINSIEADAASDAVFYNLQGARVANPQGVYIKVQDGKAAKYIK